MSYKYKALELENTVEWQKVAEVTHSAFYQSTC